MGKYHIIADMHTHTLFSDHAYSTIIENATYAAKVGAYAIAKTDHGQAIPDTGHDWHHPNMIGTIPDMIDGVKIFKGIELNIVDYDGKVDTGEALLQKLDWVIASYHTPCCKPGTIEQNTNGWTRIAENPYIDVIGHSGAEDYKYDYEKAIKIFGEQGKIVEINNHSFVARAGSKQNCRNIALLCKKHNVQIIVNSDAHIAFEILALEEALNMLESIEFPEELIVNSSVKNLEKAMDIRKTRIRSFLERKLAKEL